jgi:hypothetical protein
VCTGKLRGGWGISHGNRRAYAPWQRASWGALKERSKAMLYKVEFWATIERGETVNIGEGPAPFFAKAVERFHPQVREPVGIGP